MNKYYIYHNGDVMKPIHILANDILEADKLVKEKGINPLHCITTVGLTLKLYNTSLIEIKPCYPLIRNEDKELVPDYNQTPEMIITNNGLIKTIHIKTYDELMDFEISPDSNVIKYSVSGKEYNLSDVYKWMHYVN